VQPADHREKGTNGNGAPTNGAVVWQAAERNTEEDRLDLAEVWSVLREKRRTIAISTLLVFAVVMAITFASRMRFPVKGSIYLGDLRSQGGMLDVVNSTFDFGTENGDLTTEMAILRSRRLTIQAVLASGLNTEIRPDGWSPPRYFTWRLGGRDIRKLEGAWGELRAEATELTGNTGVGQKREVEIRFTTATDFDVFEDDARLGSGILGKPVALPGLTLTLVAGPEKPPVAGRHYDLEVYSIEDVLEMLDKDLSISAPKGAMLGSQPELVEIELSARSPYQARYFVEKLIDGYLAQNLAWKTAEAAAAEEFLSKQAENARASLDKSAKELADFKKQSSTVDLTEEAKAMLAQVSTFEQQRVTARLEVASLEQIKTALAKGNVPTEAYLVGEAQDTALMAMGQALVKAEQDYKVLEGQFTADYPPLREAKMALEGQLKAIQTYVNTRLARAREQLASIDSLMDKYTAKLQKLPDAELKMITLTQETDAYGKLYEFLLEREQQAGVTKASTISKSHVIDAPTIPSLEASPKLKFRIPLGLFLGVFLGVSLVLVRWRLATAFQSETEIRNAMPTGSLFASIPRYAADKKSEAKVLDVLASDLRSPFAEAFRLLRTNLYYSGSRERDKVIIVSSPGPGEGKTLTTLSLAAMLASDGKRVLVVDGDMRKPSHHILLRNAQQPGLSGILTKEIHWTQAVQVTRTAFGDISAITTGIVPPNPAELLSSPHLAEFLAEAKSQYDFILVDSPPFPLVSDALVLSRHGDRVLSIIRVGVTHRRAAEEHERRLSAATSHYGIVINDIADSQRYGYGYGYGDAKPGRKKRRSSKRDNGAHTS
jgi:tyrosine-protein kinase Etk/Wzc